MTSLDPAGIHHGAGVTSRGAATLVTFTVSLFVSALLLFAVEPMFAKMVLPRLGGSPAVWSTAMVFFQAALLAGYAYAHFLTRMLSVRNTAVFHLLFLAITMFTLPIVVADGWAWPPSDGQSFWLIGLFAVSVGVPFFAVAATGPLLQVWFSRSGHRHAADPYFLYGASNLGSFAALLLYPVLFEPGFALNEQSVLWSVGFLALVALIGASALFVIGPAGERAVEVHRTAARPAWRDRIAWLALAFIPSALLLAVTAHVATDIASAPFLWVLPLALYLLTFVIAFQRRPIVPHEVMIRLLPLLIAPVAIVIAVGGATNLGLLVFAHLAFFFIAAMVCHGEMVRRRPPAANLTEFYLWMSGGGVLGGIFSGLVAPQIFSTVLEYPILVVATLLALPAVRAVPPGRFARQMLVAAAITAAALVPSLLGYEATSESYLIILGAAGLLVLIANIRPAIQFGLVIGLMIVAAVYQPQLTRIQSFRSFFGVNKVAETADGRYRLLIHGTTIHGAQRIRNDDGTPYAGTPEPTTYYFTGGPISQAIDAARTAAGGLKRVAAVGLGTGSLACQAKPGEDWRFYEIDAQVVRLARDSGLFGFLSACAPSAGMILGDARLTLADEPDGSLDIIILDAFSSDAVPIHLLTREAVAGYFRKLAPHGILVFHISNRYMDLAPVVAASAAANGLVSYLGESPVLEMDLGTFHTGSIVAALARSEADLGPLVTTAGWKPLPPDPSVREWTDDYSDLLAAVIRRLKEPS